MISQDKSRQIATGKFLLKVPYGMKNMDEEKGVVIASCMPLLLFRRMEMMLVYAEKHFSYFPKSEYAILMSKNIESNLLISTALSVGQVQELINELPKSEEILQTQFIMKEMQHIIKQVLVTMLTDLLYSSFTSEENRNPLEHVDLLPTEGTTEGVVRKSESICARPASAIPKNQGNWMISYLCPQMIVKNGYQETCILEDSEWKTSFKPITGLCEFLVMCRKHSYIQSILLTDERRKLYLILKRYCRMLDTLPSIQELLKMATPNSDFAKSPSIKFATKQIRFYLVKGRTCFTRNLEIKNSICLYC